MDSKRFFDGESPQICPIIVGLLATKIHVWELFLCVRDAIAAMFSIGRHCFAILDNMDSERSFYGASNKLGPIIVGLLVEEYQQSKLCLLWDTHFPPCF